MKIIRHTDADYATALRSLNRKAEASEHVKDVVAEVISAIRARGDAALLDYTAKFDGGHPHSRRPSRHRRGASSSRIPSRCANPSRP